MGKFGESGGTRTRNHRLKRAMLYQLSYRPKLFIVNYLQQNQEEPFWPL